MGERCTTSLESMVPFGRSDWGSLPARRSALQNRLFFAGCHYLRILDYREQHSSCTRISTTLRMRYAAVPYHVPGSHADIISRCSCDHLSGFNVCNRYLIVLYYQVRNLLFVNWSSESEYFVFPALKDAEKTRC